MAVPIVAWIFTIVCVFLAVFFIYRARQGFKRQRNDEEIRHIIAMQEAQNLAKQAREKGGKNTDAPWRAAYKLDPNYDPPEIPDEIPDR